MSTGNRRVKDLPVSLRPIEKLLEKGSQNLTTAELLAIILGTGRKNQNVLKLSESILKAFSLKDLEGKDLEKLLKFKGIGKTKAARLIALKEIADRVFSQNLFKTKIITTKDAINEVKEISDKAQEYLVCLYLNARHELILKEVVAQGSLNRILIEARDIYKPAINTPCTSIILIHNHPSNDPTPSLDDITLTQRIKKAGKILGIELVDHLIITKSSYFSFKDM